MGRSASCAAVGMAEIERKVEQVSEPQTGGLAMDTEQGTVGSFHSLASDQSTHSSMDLKRIASRELRAYRVA